MTTTETDPADASTVTDLIRDVVAEGLPQPLTVDTTPTPGSGDRGVCLTISLASMADLEAWTRRIDTEGAAPDRMQVVTRVWLTRVGRLAGVETIVQHEVAVPTAEIDGPGGR